MDFSLNIGQELEILITFLPLKYIETIKQVIILAKNIERKNKKTLTKQTQDKTKIKQSCVTIKITKKLQFKKVIEKKGLLRC